VPQLDYARELEPFSPDVRRLVLRDNVRALNELRP